MKPYSYREPEVPHVIPPIIQGAPRGASASVRCENGAIYDRFEEPNNTTCRWQWERRPGTGPEVAAVAVQAELL